MEFKPNIIYMLTYILCHNRLVVKCLETSNLDIICGQVPSERQIPNYGLIWWPSWPIRHVVHLKGSER
jgi:hypothetical protein